jgi:hypothetical protein
MIVVMTMTTTTAFHPLRAMDESESGVLGQTVIPRFNLEAAVAKPPFLPHAKVVPLSHRETPQHHMA